MDRSSLALASRRSRIVAGASGGGGWNASRVTASRWATLRVDSSAASKRNKEKQENSPRIEGEQSRPAADIRDGTVVNMNRARLEADGEDEAVGPTGEKVNQPSRLPRHYRGNSPVVDDATVKVTARDAFIKLQRLSDLPLA